MPLNYILFKILSHLTKEPVAAATTPELAIHGHCDLSTQQYKLFEGMKFSDVVFVIGGFSLPQIHFSLSKHRLCCHVPSAFTRRKNDQQYSSRRHRSRTIQEMLRFIYTGKVQKMDSFAVGLFITGSKYLLW